MNPKAMPIAFKRYDFGDATTWDAHPGLDKPIVTADFVISSGGKKGDVDFVIDNKRVTTVTTRAKLQLIMVIRVAAPDGAYLTKVKEQK